MPQLAGDSAQLRLNYLHQSSDSVQSRFAPLYISERSVVTSALDLNQTFGILLAPVMLI